MIKFTAELSSLPLQQEQQKLSDQAQKCLKLKQATQQFESIFITQLLQNMRRVSFSDGEDGFGKDVMLEIADEAVSKQLAKNGMLGIGDILYKRLVKRVNPESENQQSVDPTHVSYRLPKSSTPGTIKHYAKEIASAAKQTGLSPQLIEAVIRQESGGNATAISRKGAVGLMQLMPATAAEMGVKDRLNPADNILGGALYLRAMLDRFKDLKLALAAYNAGPDTVSKYNDIPPYPETQEYVERIVSELKARR